MVNRKGQRNKRGLRKEGILYVNKLWGCLEGENKGGKCVKRMDRGGGIRGTAFDDGGMVRSGVVVVFVGEGEEVKKANTWQ